MEFRKRQRLRRQFAGSQLAEMALNGRTKIGCVGNVQRLIAELNEMTVMIGTDDELDFLAAIENLRSMLPSGWVNRMLPALLKLFEDPVGIALSKCAGRFDGADARNCCSDGAILLDADDVAPCFAIAGKLDGDGMGANLQGILDPSGLLHRREKEVQLHAMSKSGLIVVGNTR